jgi:hypothetical protein
MGSPIGVLLANDGLGEQQNVGVNAKSSASAPGISDYAGTKAAINIFSKGVAHDLADRDITVNVIQAGVIDTDMAAPYTEANLRDLASRPIKRPARVDEVAAGVLFLASSAASYMTGTIIDIDGRFAAYSYHSALNHSSSVHPRSANAATITLAGRPAHILVILDRKRDLRGRRQGTAFRASPERHP